MTSDAQLRAAMAATMRDFASVVAMVDSQHWEQPTPCTEWSVFDIVDHVVAGERFTELTLNGATVADASRAQVGIDQHEPDVLGQVTAAAAAVLEAFDGPLDRIIGHRIGPVSARRVLGFRIIDQLGHTWDVATAIGEPITLDPGALAIGLDVVRTERETLERSPNFATLSDHGGSSDPQAAFLHAIGRTPGASYISTRTSLTETEGGPTNLAEN